MINIGIAEKDRKETAHHLNLLLSNEYVLYTKTLKYHWNVVGPFFGALHELFKQQYEQLLTIVDDVAERTRTLDLPAFGTLKEFIQYATITENPGSNPDYQGMIGQLVTDHEIIIRQIRTDIDFTNQLHEMGTNNFLCDLIEKHEKMAWMLRVHLQ